MEYGKRTSADDVLIYRNKHVTLGPYYCIITYVYIVIQQYGPSVTCCFYADICIIVSSICYLPGRVVFYF